jgi:hypothetical protein
VTVVGWVLVNAQGGLVRAGGWAGGKGRVPL